MATICESYVYNANKIEEWNPSDTGIMETSCTTCTTRVQPEDYFEQICMSCLTIIICEKCHGDWTGKRYKGPVMKPCKMPDCQYLYCKSCREKNYSEQGSNRRNWICERTCNAEPNGDHSGIDADNVNCRKDDENAREMNERPSGVCIACYLRTGKCKVCGKRAIAAGKCMVCPDKCKRPEQVSNDQIVPTEEIVKRRKRNNVNVQPEKRRKMKKSIEASEARAKWTKSLGRSCDAIDNENVLK